ncbi:hypothetical protein [Actinoplanes regularis]|uniref:Uncharacterized protein n=1 Tax=Actinoplanes regularis TaxID=52697 RepID=A0A239J0E6_9ACTN|nr:hypothetical protein [Actinoplanes regularis]GIE91643.1 hypothetical protein Are01nite_81230 [Actinoplanes regularis]SNS98743.1 hypothetical protein SAMN06264365_13181 [Actinoplanes regularis]
MSKRAWRGAGGASAVLVSVAVGVATNVATDSPTTGWVVGLVVLTAVAVVIQIGLVMVDNSESDLAAPSGDASGPVQAAAAAGKGRTYQAGGNIGLTGGHLALIVSVVGFVVVGGVSAVLIIMTPSADDQGTTPSPATGPTNSVPGSPFSVKVLTDPEIYVAPQDQINTVNSFLFPPGSLATVDKPGDACYAWHSWARNNNAADLESTNLAVNITALTSDVVQVLGGRLVATSLANPGGDIAECKQGAETIASFLDIDLDSKKLSFRYGGATPAPFNITIKPDEPETIYMQATTRKCYCSWFLDLDIAVAGKDFTYRVANNGKPFVTAPSDGDYRHYVYESDSWIRIK